jgi:AP endonuclease-1
MILETPAPEQAIWADEIKLLYWMVGKKAGDSELLEREELLQERGREDREKQLEALKRKAEKAAKTSRKRKIKLQIKGDDSASSDQCETESHMDDEKVA